MEYKDISAGELAALLEVQRSNISHILNGRNMPGAAFIEKLLISFPDMDARWLITGEGEMLTGENSPVVKEVEQLDVKPSKAHVVGSVKETVGKLEKPIAKVILLFTDGTFVDYDQK